MCRGVAAPPATFRCVLCRSRLERVTLVIRKGGGARSNLNVVALKFVQILLTSKCQIFQQFLQKLPGKNV